MKKVKFNVLIALCAMMLGLSFTSCNKEPDEPQPAEATIIGTWVCYGYTTIDLDPDKSANDTKAHVYSAVFTDSTAKLHLSFYEDYMTIETDYRFKDGGDEGIIYFQKAFDDYEFRIVAQYQKAQNKLIIEATCDYWDVLEHYEMVKQQ